MNSHCNIIPSVLVFGGGAFRKWLDEGNTSSMGVSVLLKETLKEIPHLFHHYDDGEKVSDHEPENGLSPDTTCAGALTLDFQPPELWEINVCCL